MKDVFLEMLAGHEERLLGLALRRLGGHEASARDALQGALLKVWRHWKDGKVRDESKLAAIASVAVLRACRSVIRSWRGPCAALWRGGGLEAAEANVVTSRPGAPLSGEAEAIVRKAVARLSGPHRDAVRLFYVEGFPVKKVARRLGIPLGTAKRRLFMARRRLRELLAPHREQLQ